MRVLYWPEPVEALKRLATELCPTDAELVFLPRGAPEADVLAALQRADCLFGTPPAGVSAALNVALGRLKLVQLLSAGYDSLDIDAMRANEVVVANNGGANAISVAEHAIMFMLVLLRRLMDIDASLRAGTYRPVGADALHELYGQTVGLIGFGPVGRQVAKRLKAFDATVLYYDIVPAPAEVEHELSVELRPLDELFSRATIVSLHVPLNDQTRGLINRDTIARMRPGAILINTARGELVNEADLADAIRDGRIGAAGLDVFSVEPPPPDHLLLQLGTRVVATAHNAGPTWESWPRRFENAFANARRAASGDPPLWIIPELRD